MFLFALLFSPTSESQAFQKLSCTWTCLFVLQLISYPLGQTNDLPVLSEAILKGWIYSWQHDWACKACKLSLHSSLVYDAGWLGALVGLFLMKKVFCCLFWKRKLPISLSNCTFSEESHTHTHTLSSATVYVAWLCLSKLWSCECCAPLACLQEPTKVRHRLRSDTNTVTLAPKLT